METRKPNEAVDVRSVSEKSKYLLYQLQHFNFQPTYTTLKNVVIKHFKISKIAALCFGLQGNHHQGATIST